MTKFNPENKEALTYGECLGPAMEITDQDDADQYLKAYVKFIQDYMDKEKEKGVVHPTTALEVAKINLGYFSGYYDHDVMKRVNRLFHTSHPIFGNTSPSTKEAFEAGKNFAKTKK